MGHDPLRALTPWVGIPPKIDVDKYVGFIYEITNTVTGRKYIGKKAFVSHTSKKVKGFRKRIKTVSESNWRYYKSSSEELKKDMARLGIDNFKFRAIKLCESKLELTYYEALYQFKHDVLGSLLPDGNFKYYNTNILSKFFRGKLHNNITRL